MWSEEFIGFKSDIYFIILLFFVYLITFLCCKTCRRVTILPLYISEIVSSVYFKQMFFLFSVAFPIFGKNYREYK